VAPALLSRPASTLIVMLLAVFACGLCAVSEPQGADVAGGQVFRPDPVFLETEANSGSGLKT